MKKFFIIFISCLLLFLASPLTAVAEFKLPEGAVKGLPEKLAALDSDGMAVNSETGYYFFHVENMEYGQVYSKEVQLMNLREDHAYYIYFYVEPLFKAGEIDLEKGCNCKFFLDNKEIYHGDVNGNGSIDLTEKYFSCGYYRPGDSHILRCEVVWNDLDVIQEIDNGHKLVDKDGKHVLTGTEEFGHVEGEIEFKWIFFASVKEISSYIEDEQETTDDSGSGMTESETEPPTDVEYRSDESETIESERLDSVRTSQETESTEPVEIDHSSSNTYSKFFSPFTGYLAKDGTVWLICIGAVSIGILILMILLHKEKKKRKKKK